MDVVYEQAGFPEMTGGSVVTIGVFDGVHVGHQALLGEVKRASTELQCPSVVVTFDRHPLSVVAPETAPKLLTDLHQRLELLGAQGVDLVGVVRFDEERSLETPREFVRELVAHSLRAKAVVVGENFQFGHHHRGDATLLSELGTALSFKTIVQPLVRMGGVDHPPVSSTAIREALGRNDVELSARLLGRLYEVRGVVEGGDARGRQLGFPTANVSVPGDVMLPDDGVFAGWYERPDGSVYRTAVSLGRRPTFYAEHGLRLLEAYLLDFDGDLYDERAKVRIQTYLRGQRRFDSIDALTDQLGQDVDATRAALTDPPR